MLRSKMNYTSMELLFCLTRVFRVASQNPGSSCVSLRVTTLDDALTCIREMSWISCRILHDTLFTLLGSSCIIDLFGILDVFSFGVFVTKRRGALYTDFRDLPDGTIWEINRTRHGPDNLQGNATGSQAQCWNIVGFSATLIAMKSDPANTTIVLHYTCRRV